MTKKQKKWLSRIIVSLVLFIALIIVEKLVDFEKYQLINFLCYILIYLLIGYDVIFKALRNISHGQVFDENFLMLIATVGALVIGKYSEAVAVLIFYQVGEFFQNYAVNKSRKSIADLMDIRPDYANIYENGELKQTDPETINTGDIIVCKPGEKIPLDGIIRNGSTTIDTKALTGEALPINKTVGDEILSGCINLSGVIEVEVTKTFYDSTVNKILDLVENAQTKKSKSENFITKFAKYYTPIVVISSILLAIIPGIITKNYQEWIYRSLNFLVVSCPCAIVISVPLSFFSALGACSKCGILVKGSNYLESISKANIFVLDKTGTLTKGNFVVDQILSQYPDETIQKAMICERNINHPIALSIMDYYNKNCSEKKDIQKLDEYQINELSGYGVIASRENEVIYCGNYKLMQNNDIQCSVVNECGTVIYVAVNDKYLGAIVINDEIKAESYDFINYLNANKISSIMLTGDNYAVSENVSKKLNITSFKSSLLPQDKMKELDNILANKTSKDVVCFIGDGINDAPSITRSDVGLSMGNIGSDAAIEASDIVLMNDDLSSIITLKKIAKKTMVIVKENIIFAIGIKVLVLFLSAFGVANMWMSIFSDVGVAILAIINATRAANVIKK